LEEVREKGKPRNSLSKNSRNSDLKLKFKSSSFLAGDLLEIVKWKF
jgi:hypothetical protein